MITAVKYKIEIDYEIISKDDSNKIGFDCDFEKMTIKVNGDLDTEITCKYKKCEDALISGIIKRFVWQKHSDGLGNVGNNGSNGLGFGKKLWLKMVYFKQEFVKVLK